MTKTSVLVGNKEFIISAGNGKIVSKAPFDDKDTPRYKFRVKVIYNGQEVGFDFYGSRHDYGTGQDTLIDDDLRNAFSCFIDDCLYGLHDFENFCSELGYDVDSRKAHSIFTACRRSTAKALKLGLSEQDMCDIVNRLNEMDN